MEPQKDSCQSQQGDYRDWILSRAFHLRNASGVGSRSGLLPFFSPWHSPVIGDCGDLVAFDAYSYIWCNFKRDQFVTELGDPAHQPPGSYNLIVAFQSRQHLLMVSRFFGLRPDKQKIHYGENQDDRDNRIGRQLLPKGLSWSSRWRRLGPCFGFE